MKQVIAVLTAVAFVSTLPGCVTTQQRTMAELRPSPWMKIAGFTTRDGRQRACYCEARVEGDRLVLRPREAPADPDSAREIELHEETIRIQEVVTLDVVEGPGMLIALAIIGVFAAVIGLLAWIGLSSLSHSHFLGPWH